jgi:hypothetical protein
MFWWCAKQEPRTRVRVVGRLARVVAVGVAHHVTQRGDGRRFLLDSDADRPIYLELLQENLRLHELLLITAAMSGKLPVPSPGYPPSPGYAPGYPLAIYRELNWSGRF